MQNYLYVEINYCDDTNTRQEFQDSGYGELEFRDCLWKANRMGEKNDSILAPKPHIIRVNAKMKPASKVEVFVYACPCKREKVSA